MNHPRLFASVQPAHLLDDASVAEERLGPRRAALSYPIKSLLDRGCRVIFGSDWDVADLNPLVGLQAAVTRVDNANRFPGGWHPEQRISVARAIEGYSSTPTLATRIPQRAGKLMTGMEAHLTVLDRDITSIPPDQITKAKALMTIIGGHIVNDGSS
jgi:predicted amidohydrolase YtcJ